MTSATLDSNVYISALEYSGIGARLLAMARAGMIRVDTSSAILDETIGVLRDKFGWEGYRLHFAKQALQKLANVVEPTETLTVTDDPDDNRILECAIEAGSDFVVTHDADLLRLSEYQGSRIVKPSQFLEHVVGR